jgi:hypothetical protein
VLTPDIGAIAYKTDLLVIDMLGLADPYVARHPWGKPFLDYVYYTQPDIIATHQIWLKGTESDPRLLALYVPVYQEWVDWYGLWLGIYVRKDLIEAKPECLHAAH